MRDPVTVVHTHTPVGGLVGRLAAVAARQGPIVHTFHGLPLPPGKAALQDRAFLAVERFAAKRTDHFFSQSAGDADRAVHLGIARRETLTVIGNGVDLRRFKPNDNSRREVREELGIPPEAVVVVMAARLVREKGVLDFADAALRLAGTTKAHFVLVGSALPSDRTDVSADLRARPIASMLGQRWHQLGYRLDIERVLAAADIFAFPSYREGLPRSVIEALATALPVVASDIAACRELVEPGQTGLLVPTRDVTGLALALENLIDDANLRNAMGAAGRQTAIRRHDEQMIIATQVRILGGLARSRGLDVTPSP